MWPSAGFPELESRCQLIPQISPSPKFPGIFVISFVDTMHNCTLRCRKCHKHKRKHCRAVVSIAQRASIKAKKIRSKITPESLTDDCSFINVHSVCVPACVSELVCECAHACDISLDISWSQQDNGTASPPDISDLREQSSGGQVVCILLKRLIYIQAENKDQEQG